MTRSNAGWRGLLAGILLAIAGCSPGPSPTPSLLAPTSAPPTAAVTPAAPTGLAVMELPAAPTVLAAGRYTRAAFEPKISFEVAKGEWQTGQLLVGFFDIQQDVGSPDVIAVQFARPSGVYGADGAAVTVSSPAAALAAIEANPGLEVLSSSESRMSGLTGIVVEIENPASAPRHVEVLRVPPGPLGIDPGRRLWIALFDSTDGLLAIMVGGSVARWDEALLTAEPITESVTIGD